VHSAICCRALRDQNAYAHVRAPALQGVRDGGGRKDANEVLVRDGARALRAFLEASPPYPIEGLHQFKDYSSKIWAAYDGVNEGDQPVSTGWRVLDEFYRVVPGELTVVTGALPLSTSRQRLRCSTCASAIP
jgi:hypothetical protein